MSNDAVVMFSAEWRYGRLAWTVDDPRIEPCPTTGCWLWAGAHSGATGYGKVGVAGKMQFAHRVFLQKNGIIIPSGMVVDHMCRNRMCVNPDHLRIVTPRQSSLENCDSPTARNARQTHCLACGGDFHVTRSGARVCKPCRRLSSARRMSNPVIREQTNRRAREKRAMARNHLEDAP